MMSRQVKLDPVVPIDNVNFLLIGNSIPIKKPHQHVFRGVSHKYPEIGPRLWTWNSITTEHFVDLFHPHTNQERVVYREEFDIL